MRMPAEQNMAMVMATDMVMDTQDITTTTPIISGISHSLEDSFLLRGRGNNLF